MIQEIQSIQVAGDAKTGRFVVRRLCSGESEPRTWLVEGSALEGPSNPNIPSFDLLMHAEESVNGPILQMKKEWGPREVV